MPKTKLHDHVNRYDAFVRLIWGAMAAEGLTVDDMEARTGISRTRLYNRKKKPAELTLEEITTLCRNLSIPIDDVRAALRY